MVEIYRVSVEDGGTYRVSVGDGSAGELVVSAAC